MRWDAYNKMRLPDILIMTLKQHLLFTCESTYEAFVLTQQQNHKHVWSANVIIYTEIKSIFIKSSPELSQLQKGLPYIAAINAYFKQLSV